MNDDTIFFRHFGGIARGIDNRKWSEINLSARIPWQRNMVYTGCKVQPSMGQFDADIIQFAAAAYDL
jgi:hypothetical protein